MQFKIDENLPSSVVEIFTERSFDYHTVYDEKIQGIDDGILKKSKIVKKINIINPVDFISLINAEQSNYTKWRKNLFEDMTIEEIIVPFTRNVFVNCIHKL